MGAIAHTGLRPHALMILNLHGSVLAATLLKVVYGIDVEDENHEIIRMIDVALEGPAQAFVPGKYLVDVFPLLQYVPEWLPGANFQKMFAKWRKANLQMKEILFKTRNTAFVCFTLILDIR